MMKNHDCSKELNGKKFNSLKEELSECLDVCGIEVYGLYTPVGQRGVYFYVDGKDAERVETEFLGECFITGSQHKFFLTNILETEHWRKYYASSILIK